MQPYIIFNGMKTIDYRKAFGSFLRNTRMREGISQESFAFKFGINRTYYGDIERGESSITLDKIQIIANCLGMSASELLAAVERESG